MKETTVTRGINAAPPEEHVPIDFRKMNDKHAFVMIKGKVMVLTERFNPRTKTIEIDYSTPRDMGLRYKDMMVEVGNGNLAPVYPLWEKSATRRAYWGGIVFEPNCDHERNEFNLWTGFAVEPDPNASCERFLEHVYENICCGDLDLYNWTMAWLARLVQSPGAADRPGSALVLIGEQGTGKNAFADYFGDILGKHYLALSNPEDVTGSFNAHFQTCVLACVDEAVWNKQQGDKGRSILKAFITQPTILTNEKYQPKMVTTNCTNLIFLSNDANVVPAEPGDRRFVIYQVSEKHQNDREYFDGYFEERFNGGPAALLYHLQQINWPNFDLRTTPKTAGHADQMVAHMNDVQQYLYEIGNSKVIGEYVKKEPNQDESILPVEIAEDKTVLVKKSLMHADYAAYCRQHRYGKPKSPSVFWSHVRAWFPADMVPESQLREFNRERVVEMPMIEDYRAGIEKKCGQVMNWEVSSSKKVTSEENDDEIPGCDTEDTRATQAQISF